MMKRQISCSLGLAAMFWLANPSPTFAVSKEMIQLQTQVQGLQDQMSRMQQAFDERMGVMKSLIDQSTDNINKMTAAVDTLQKSLQQQNADTAGKVDQVSGQVQALMSQVTVVGAGAAGLYTALCAARDGARVTLVSATPLAESSSWWAQGGLAAAVSAFVLNSSGCAWPLRS